MKITGHAKKRMREMDISLDEVMAIVHEPAIATPDDLPNRSRLTDASRLLVVVEHWPEPKADRLITVLWWSPEERIER